MRGSDPELADTLPARRGARSAGFHCEIGWLGPGILRIAYGGYVPAGEQWVRRTEEAVLAAAPPVSLCFELDAMTGFDHSQVMLHAKTLTRLARRIHRIALVGARPRRASAPSRSRS